MLPVFFDYAEYDNNGLPFWTADNLQAMYNDFLAEAGLPLMCAESLIFEDLTPDNRQWVSRFIRLWEDMEKASAL